MTVFQASVVFIEGIYFQDQSPVLPSKLINKAHSVLGMKSDYICVSIKYKCQLAFRLSYIGHGTQTSLSAQSFADFARHLSSVLKHQGVISVRFSRPEFIMNKVEYAESVSSMAVNNTAKSFNEIILTFQTFIHKYTRANGYMLTCVYFCVCGVCRIFTVSKLITSKSASFTDWTWYELVQIFPPNN